MLYRFFQISIILLYIPLLILAEIRINITEGIDTPYPINIIPFNSNKNIALKINNIAEIIASDLKNTGKFNVMSHPEFFEQQNNTVKIISNAWKQLGSNILLSGNINISNKNYIISYQLINISKSPIEIILQNKYTASEQWIRYVAHTISNDIFEKLTGIKGSFCTQIAYIARINNTQYPYKLYISDYDGHNQILIHQSSEPLMSPTWNPSGNQLVYVVFSNNRSILVAHDLNIGSIRQIISMPQHNGAPAFSPDGKKLSFTSSKTGSLNLYVMDLVSNKIRQITNNRSNNTEASWFPDNKTLSYTSDRGGSPQIYKIDINNINDFSERISWSNFTNQNSNVSSDGKFIIMVSRNNVHQNITKLNLATGEYQVLSNNNKLDETPTLSPNNMMLIYSSSDGIESKLYLLSIDGRHKVQLPINHKVIRFPTWSPYIQ